MKGAAGGVVGDLARARVALEERGQRLGELDEKTAGMMASAEAFSKQAHEVGILGLCTSQGPAPDQEPLKIVPTSGTL